jgi:SAM-dependent methyltransferase
MTLHAESNFQEENYNSLKGKFTTEESYRVGKLHRIGCIALAEKVVGSPIHGSFIEIGAGTGYFSAYLLSKRPETRAILVECTDAVLDTIHHCMSVHSVSTDRYAIEICDFTTFVAPEPVDYVFAMGAIHHSYALGDTMNRICENLKPGGYLIVHEPAFDDFQSRESLQHHYQQRLGIDPSKSDPKIPRYDFFFRESEYRRAAISAGFDVLAWISVEPTAGASWPMLARRSLANAAKKLLGPAPLANSTLAIAQPNSYLMIFRKPPNPIREWIPHKFQL